MVPRRRAMHVASLVLVIIVATFSVASLVLAETPNPLARQFTLSKDASPEDSVDVGDEVTITLTFRNRWTEDAFVVVTDANPNPAWFRIVQSSIIGATYVEPVPPAPEKVVWEGVLQQGKTQEVTFSMEVIGGAGRQAINRAFLNLEPPVQSIAEVEANADIFIKPAAPVLEEIDNDDGADSYLVEWSEAAGALIYVLEEDDDSAFDSPTSIYPGSDTQILLKDRDPGTYYYRVYAFGDGTVSEPSNVVSTTVKIGTPVLLDIENPDTEPDYLVEWSDVNGATDYGLEEDDNSGFSSPTTRYLGPQTQYQVKDQPDGHWYYRVRAYGPGGRESDWSEPKSTWVGSRFSFLPVMVQRWPPPPEAPTLKPIVNPDGLGEYSVEWSSETYASTYVLEEAWHDAFQSPANTYEVAATEYDVTGKGASRLYYRVKGRNATGDSLWSNVKRVDVTWHWEGPVAEERQTNGPLASGMNYQGAFLNQTDISDYFFLVLSTESRVRLWLRDIPPGHNFDLALRDVDLLSPFGWYSVNPNNEDEYVEVASVPAGLYYVQVYNKSGPGSTKPYELRVVLD